MIEYLRSLLRSYVELKKVIVNTKTGTSLRGVVRRCAGPYLVLHQSQILSDRGTTIAAKPMLDGEILIAHADVDFIQVIA